MCVFYVCKEETKRLQKPVSRFMRWEDKQGEGRTEWGSRMYAGVSKGEDPTALYIRTKCLSQYLLLCVCVCACMCTRTWAQVNTKSTTTNPQS